MPDVKLSVNGSDFGGWKEINIQRGIEQISGSFDVGVSERWPGQSTPRRIRPGDACTVSVDGETVITGYVDDLRMSYDSDQHTVQVSGRDKTGDLVDCSAIHSPGEWHNIGLLKLAGILCQPFGINVKSTADLGSSLKSFAVQESETAFEALDRAARMRGVLLMTDGRGGLLMTRSGSTQSSTRLVRGRNILGASGEYSHKDRYSTYRIKGQRRGTDDDVDIPEAITEINASSLDSGVKRYRPLLVLAEDLGDGISFKTRSDWERSTRVSKSIRSTVTVQGWREQGESGSLWTPNELVHLDDEWQGINSKLLIASVTFELDENGTRTVLSLTHPAAFDELSDSEHQKATKKQDSGLHWL